MKWNSPRGVIRSAPITGAIEVTGTWTATADGTYLDNTTTSGTESIELSSDCLSISGTVTTCSRISGPLSVVGFAALTCTDNPDTGGCTCSGTIDQPGGVFVRRAEQLSEEDRVLFQTVARVVLTDTAETLAEIGARLGSESNAAYEASPYSTISKDYFARFSRDPKNVAPTVRASSKRSR